VRFYIIIPAHNEEAFIENCLISLSEQSLRPKKIVVVDDNSTDKTPEILKALKKQYAFIDSVQHQSSEKHLPGEKIITAFYKGFEQLDQDYDVVCKFDADLVFPRNYLETIAQHFKKDQKLGLVAGHCYIEKNGQWILENLTSNEHIRGPLKAYRKECFKSIGGLQKSMGWDTIDELVALYNGWSFRTDNTLHVKHLKPTGSTYNKSAKYYQGIALYKMRNGFVLAFLSALKLAYKKRKIRLFLDYLMGYFKAWQTKVPYIVSEEEGAFIRSYRWRKIKKLLSPF
jgi:glycosyltransferase involved in cell wall biosynthesis